MILWLDNAPIFSEGCGIEGVINFIDEFISCERNPEGSHSEFVKFQFHKHTHTCRKKSAGKKGCRFQFPKPPMKSTMILLPLGEDCDSEVARQAKSDNENIQDHLNSMGKKFTVDIPFEEFLNQLGLTEERYVAAIRSTLRRPSIFLKRSTNAIFINGYNPKILQTWRANIDIQYILDEYACASYILSYINKSDGGISKLLKQVNEDVRRGNLCLRDRLRKIGNVFNNFTQVSQQEAAVGVLGINLVNSSRGEIFVSTGPPDERTRILKTEKELRSMPEDCEDVLADNVISRYVDRPEEMESVCLADFAAKYTFTKRKPTGQHIELESGYMIPREKPLILRYRRYGEQSDSLNFFREQLMLFYPWRDEETELLAVNCEARYYEEEIQSLVCTNRATYHRGNFGEAVDEAIQCYVAPPEVPGICSVANSDQELSDVFKDLGFDRTSSRKQTLLAHKLLDTTTYLGKVRSLNDKQRRFLLHCVHKLKTGQVPFYEFLSGGAGVGKSHLIEAMVQFLLRHFGKIPSFDLDTAWILVCAPTGRAAFNVKGMTLHHCFHLPPSQSKYEHLNNLSDDQCNQIRTKYLNLKVIIIDEVSMVSSQMLLDVNRRLQQIFQSREPFGGIPVIVVGHLRQLAPVCGRFVFLPPSSAKLFHLAENSLWRNFQLYEFDEIMRQKGDLEFCAALNNMAEGRMTEEDIKLIQSRQIGTIKQPITYSRLFWTNEQCQAFNHYVHDQLPGKVVTCESYDRVQGEGTVKQKEQFKPSRAPP